MRTITSTSNSIFTTTSIVTGTSCRNGNGISSFNFSGRNIGIDTGFSLKM